MANVDSYHHGRKYLMPAIRSIAFAGGGGGLEVDSSSGLIIYSVCSGVFSGASLGWGKAF
jgi:hypothetical protein